MMTRLFMLFLLAAAPFGSALAQRESPFAVYFFGSVADDRTTRPSGFNPNCWSSETVGGAGVFFEYTTPVSVTLSSGLHYLGTHKNKNCTPEMRLETAVVPFTVGYAFALGDYITLTPKLGVAYMSVTGRYNSHDSSDGSVKPTYGVALEGRLARHWGLRAEVNRYTGATNLFNVPGEFQQDFRVFSLGGVFRW
jgi:hypothetical protein